LLGHELVHFNYLTIEEFIYEFFRFYLLLFLFGHSRLFKQVEVNRFVQRQRKWLQATMTANLKRPLDLSGNSYMVRMPVQAQHDVHRAKQLQVERVARRNELP
jgi:hypothetical protein